MMQPTKKKIRSRHKVNIKKQRLKQKKIVEKKQRQGEKDQPIKADKKKPVRETALDIRIARETNIYWIRGATGALSALILRIIGFVGWTLFLWMIGLIFLVPFLINYALSYEFDKEEWTWKNVLKPGLGLFFFLFMFVGVIIHTSLEVLGIGIKITFQGIYYL